MISERRGPLEHQEATEVTAAELAGSPAWFPLEAASADMLRLIGLDEAMYRQASFLDQRILATNPRESVCSIDTAATAAGMLHARANYIFHIGHVGSTLISRLLGDYPSFFSVREPALLRALAAGAAKSGHAPSLTVTLPLLSRTWHTRQQALIKATSFVSEIAAPILATDERANALFVFTPALAYLRCILGGPNSRMESRALAPSRVARLQARIGGIALPHSEGEWVAMSWLCEMTALCQAAAQCGPRGRWLNFEAFVASPAIGLADALLALGASPATQEVDALLTGPWMGRYSKAPEHPYDAVLRRSVLQAADREHRIEIRRGMDWLARAAERHPLIDAALAR